MELDVCARAPIPHGFFLGGPFRWTQDDRDKAIAHHLRRAAACPACGTRAEEWDDNPHAYHGVLRRCLGCEETQRIRASITEQDGRGVYVALEKARGKT